MAFVGGIDLCHGDATTRVTRGDRQASRARRAATGPAAVARRPARGRGPGRRRPRVHVPRAVGRPDAARPPQPGPVGCATWQLGNQPRDPIRCRRCGPPTRPSATTRCRSCAPIRRSGRAYPFAPDGERSIARAYLKAFAPRAAARSTSRTSTSGPSTPPTRSPTRCGAHPSSRRRRRAARSRPRRARVGPAEPHRPAARCWSASAAAGGDRVAVVRPRERRRDPDLRARQGLHRRRRVDGRRLRQPQPPIVDARLRAACAVLDAHLDDRSRPIRPASATAPRRFARELRLGLMSEELDLAEVGAERDELL